MRYMRDMPKIKRELLRGKSNTRGLVQKAHTILSHNLLETFSIYFDNRNEFPIKLAITAIIKNEAAYVKEWIEYHKLVGVSKFYLFDNESSDNLKDVLYPYIESGLVEYFVIKGKGKQLEAYQKAIKIAKNEAKWLAIIDLDEFILPLDSSKSIVQLLDEKKRSAMLIGWMIYGSNGYIEKQDGLVIDIFRKHATNDFIADCKTIVNPRKVFRVVNPHYCIVAGKTTDENGKVLYQYPYTDRPEATPMPKQRIRINHYYSKSWEEFERKSQRGYADKSSNKRSKRNIASFKDHDQNKVADHYMDRYIRTLKKVLKV